MQYQLLGLSSGSAAHILSTLLVGWRRMLRGAAYLGVGTFAATEVVAFTLLHRFPPSLPTNVVALAIGVAMAYSAAASVFIQELFRGAIRALDMLEGKAAEALGIAPVTAFTTSAQPEMATPLPLRSPQVVSSPGVAGGGARLQSDPLYAPDYQLPREEVGAGAAAPSTPSLPSMPSMPSMPSVPSIPAIPAIQVTTGMPAVAGARASGAGRGAYADPYHDQFQEARRPVEEEPTHPVGAGPDDGATIMVIPENSMYVPRLVPQPRPVAAPLTARAAEHEPLHPLPKPARQAVSQPPAAAAPRRLAPLAAASPSPALYAPWAVVPPIADPTAKTELSTMAAHEAALAFQPVRRPNWWPRRKIQPLPVDGR